MSLFSKFWSLLGFGRNDDDSSSTSSSNSPADYDVGDNGLPSGWHFVGYVDNDGKTHYIGDEITDQQVRDADRVFIAKTWGSGKTSYRQFSSAQSKDAIGDMLIRESGEGSPV